jgi:hypothetical protein
MSRCALDMSKALSEIVVFLVSGAILAGCYSSARGFLGVCYETGPGPWGGGWGGADGLDFRIIDTRGMPLGAPLVIDSEMENIGGCDVGWSGSDFLVIYWSCGGDSEFNQIIAQRVVPLF